MRCAAAALALVATLAGAADRPEQSRTERLAVEGVVSAIEHRDCPRAASRLNDGLAARWASMYLMAGTMYEEGLCLKPNWDRARQMYERAAAAGHQGGTYRLIAGLARPDREPGAAVWWAQQQRRLAMPADCRVPDWVHRDAEAYVVTLKAWPAGRLAACAYVAGVMATLTGDLEYPSDSLQLGIAGKVQSLYVPAEARFEWRTTDVQTVQLRGVVSGETLMDRDSRSAQDGLRRHLQAAGERALRRYVQPAGVDPGWRIDMIYEFSIYNE